MKKTKIICTISPNTSDKDIMVELARNGMDVARFSSSHGDYNEHQGRLELLEEVHKELGIPVAALLDTRGPETRTGRLKDGKKVALREGQTCTLTTRELVSNDTIGCISYSELNEDVATGNRILVDDGLIKLEVRQMKDTNIICEVVNEGELGEKKGVSVPDVKIKLSALTDKDKEGIRFRIKQSFDFVAAFFVHTANCTKKIKAMLDEQGSSTKVTAKIENTEDIENLDIIIGAADDIMVARDDMGMEIPTEKVPRIQKKIIRKCNEAYKIIITATQILDSTIHNPRPTRVKMIDVASAVYDGTDTVMLSGKTAMGKYPMDALKVMVSIALEAEMRLDYAGYRQRKVTEQNMKNVSNAMCFASVSTAHDPDADVIIAPSITGFTIQTLSKWRSSTRIIGVSPSMATIHQMQLQQGVVPVWSHHAESMGELIENSVEELKSKGLVEEGELAVITAGVVTYTRRHEATTQTNVMRVINVE